VAGRGERGDGRRLAAVYAVLLGVASAGFAVLAGLGGPPGNADDVWLIARGLLISVLSGLAAVACMLRAVRRPVLAPALALGLLPAAVEVVWLALS
jgi:hypothetical protein